MDKEYISLSNVKVIFCDLEDKGYGKNIVIDASEERVQEAICKWVEENKIGKQAGVANFKEYKNEDGTVTYQYTFKIGKFTQFGDGKTTCDITSARLNRGDTINLLAKAYTYDNKFGKGVSHVLNAVYLKSRGASKSAIERLAEM